MSWLTSGSTRAEVELIFRTQRRGRVMGAGATVAVFGVAMFSPPTAHADDFGLGDLIGDLIASASTAEVGTQAVDQALAASASGAETISAADLFQQYIYDPLHASVESWINSPFGEQVDHLLNTASGQFLIGNGADGTGPLDPNGGDGGLWFGDGGKGWDSDEAGVAGGSGGDAVGFFGSGGEGGMGGTGAAGGDGGDAGSLFGIGGDGGNAGAGATAAGLPALGGAGGNAGEFGEHGMVGDYGTLPGGLTPTADPDGSLPSLGTSGGWLTNSDGQVVMLHGLNEVYKVAPGDPLSSGFGDDDAAFLAENGFNAVRVGVIWSDLEPAPGVFDTTYLELDREHRPYPGQPRDLQHHRLPSGRLQHAHSAAKVHRTGPCKPTGWPTPRCPSRSTCSSTPQSSRPGSHSGRTPTPPTALVWRTTTARCWST